MNLITATILLAVLTAAASTSTTTRQTLQKPKCPGTCRLGPGSLSIVKKECKKSKVWCAASLKKCVIAPCSQTVGGTVKKGYKCVCPACLNKCYGGLKGLKKAEKECGSRQCHSQTTANDRCILQTCVTNTGKNGFKCACRSPTGTCPEVCRKKKIGEALANVECSPDNSPLCPDSRRRCEVQDCRLGTKPGKKCSCPLTNPLPCPDVCRFDAVAELTARKECAIDRVCVGGKCDVRKCYRDGRVGYKCGCKDEIIPPQCPDICRFDGKAKEGARMECSIPRLCTDGNCDVRKCYRGGLVGYKCGCTDEVPPPACPDRCYVGRSAEMKADIDCEGDHFCSDGKCDVRRCFIGDIVGFKCGCKDEEPPKACPNKCRFDADAEGVAKEECSEDRLCVGGECLVRKCYHVTGRQGYKCGCRDEIPPPKPCPENCYTNSTGKDLADKECSVPHKCVKGTCDLRRCYLNGREGYKCGCQDEEPPKGCPGICHGGSSGQGAAQKDCDRKPTCEESDRLCEVQGCEIRGMDGWKCDCPKTPTSCSETCRVDAAGMLAVRTECADKPFCKDSKQICQLRKCMVSGRRGLQCACPVKPGCSNTCQTTKGGIIAVSNECAAGPQCTLGGVKCQLQACRVGLALGKKCACPTLTPCPNKCETSKSGILTAELECRTNPVCTKTLKPCVMQGCRVGVIKGRKCGCSQKLVG